MLFMHKEHKDLIKPPIIEEADSPVKVKKDIEWDFSDEEMPME